MNRSEYIPGDLATYNGNIITIENNDGYYATYYDEDESLQTINVNVIEGIPLTPEILKKNGWRKLKSKRYTWWRARFDGIYYFVKSNKNYPSVWDLCRGHTRHHFKIIKYIHQLQNFLFGLGLNHEMEV